MNIKLLDLVFGAIAVTNTDGFPLESMPPQGGVTVEFASGTKVDVDANLEEFEAAKAFLELKQTNERQIKAFKLYLQTAFNMFVDEKNSS